MAQNSKALKVYQQYIETVGDLAHWETLQSWERTSTRKDGLRVTSIAKKPDQFQLIFQWDQNKVIKSYDGQNGWLERNGVYTAMRPGEEIEMAEEPEFYEDLVSAHEMGYELYYEGKEKLGKVKCDKLRMTKSDHDEQWYWINRKTHMLEMVGEFSEDPAHDGIFYTTRFEDYRNVDGFLIPFTEHLIRNGTDTTSIYYSTMHVNPGPEDRFFRYEPDNAANLIRWMKDEFAEKVPKAYTFVQETVHFHGEDPDTNTWYEAILFPDKFRIDFGDPANGFCNLTVGDTMYAFRKHKHVASIYEPQLFLLLEGGIYHLSPEKVMRRLPVFGIDTTAFRISSREGEQIAILGNPEHDSLNTVVTISCRHGNLIAQSEILEDGQKLETNVIRTKLYGDYCIPEQIEFYLNEKLVQIEYYREVDITPEIPESLFNPHKAYEKHWYSN